jgi:hypothetical protein
MTRRYLASLFTLPAAFAWQARAQSVPADASTTIDPDGTVHITRAVPVPKTVSPEAYAKLVTGTNGAPDDGSKEAADIVEKMRVAYPVDIEHTTVGGVNAKIVIPKNAAIYGTSAGAILTAEMAVQLKGLGLPLPAALGYFSGFCDMARSGDAGHLYSIPGFMGFRPSFKLTEPVIRR